MPNTSLPAPAPRASLALVAREKGAARSWSFERGGTVVTLREGPVGGKSKQTEKTFGTEAEAVAFCDKSLQAKVEKGYFSSELGLRAVPLSEVQAELKVADNAEPADARVLVFDGDLVVPHDLVLDEGFGLLAPEKDAPSPYVGLLVRGSLTIEGSLLNFEDDTGPFLQVEGALVARCVGVGGSQIRVNGSVHTGELVGVYNHGHLDVGGDLDARIVATEHAVTVAGKTNALRYLGWGASIFPVTDGVEDASDPHDAKGVFVAGVLKKAEGQVDLSLARERVAARKPILLDAPVSVRAEFRKQMAKKLEAPEKLKSLALTRKNLSVLPAELFQFRRLEKLDLTGNTLRTLPEELGQLTELRELRLNGNGLQELPESIGNLEKLVHLDLEANCLWRLPDSLARCTELRTLNLINNPYSYVRASFGSWSKVKVLRDFPEVLTRLPKLEVVEFKGTFLRSLPARAFDSKRLQRVSIRDSLITDVDKALHPLVEVDLEHAKQTAADFVRFWFAYDTVHLVDFYDAKTRRYDFTDVIALVGLLLDAAVPIPASYEGVLATWRQQIERVGHAIDRSERNPEHARALFGALRDALDTLGKPYGANALVDGLRALFDERARA
ncbi:leucine-rich repeat-containing protein [Corallococcus macrosporus]|uniref:Leucine-rich repeat protein n=1 Tax=Myxococcus fulvus (strain ATCC BAA-855 / HW-1) TaxID=483219 RepID=F8CQY3_MYXFH|nr:leucine-rich repeat-containing protein [Corallococcus macrosporus]AEI63027.1 leucine-rich repeat protein [Corallococcus macrosporus]